MSQLIQVQFNGAAGQFVWTTFDNGNLVTSGTGTSVIAAGSAALTAMKSYLGTQAANYTALGTQWQ